MLNISEAKKIMLKNLPGVEFNEYVEYKRLFVFQAFYGDSSESGLDSFYFVDRVNGNFGEFPLMSPENFLPVMALFEGSAKR